LTACAKETNNISKIVTSDTIRITIHDTLRIHDTVTTLPETRLQTLTKKTWQIDQVERSISGTNSEFVRGGNNSTGVAYYNIRIKFNADGTGTYTDENSMTSSLNWSFNSSDQRTATLTVGQPNPAVFTWDLLELKDNYLHCVTPFNSNSLYGARYIQIP